MLRRPGVSVIGLDVGPRGVAAVQLSGRGQSRRIAASAWLPRAVGAGAGELTGEECTRIRSVLERHGFRGNQVAVPAPDAALRTSPLELPPRSSGAPIAQLARLELARTHRIDSAAMEVAVWDLPGSGGAGTSVLAAALPHAEAEAALAPLDAAGFEVVAVEPRVCALCRLAARAAEPAAVTGVIDLGERAAVLCVIHHWSVAYERVTLEGGVGPLRDALARELQIKADIVGLLLEGRGESPVGMPPEGAALVTALGEGLGTDIKAAIEYVTRQRAGGKAEGGALLCGSGARIAGILEGVSAVFGSPARVLTPTVALPGDAAASDPALATAMGLAMHEEGR